MQTAFRIVTRNGADSQYPALVFDLENRLHFPLTIFATEAVKRSSVSTARAYLNAILPFFSWPETDEWQKRAVRSWDDAPERIRRSIQDYLIARLKCKLKEHRAGFQLVSLTAGARSTVRVFLSALKLYYRVMRAQGFYHYDNPLVDGLSPALAEVEEGLAEDGLGPRLPQISGVVAPRKKQRLSDSYFKLVGEVWVPQVIDDPQFPARVFTGGQKIGWRLREQCIARILFESGGRVSEVVGQTLGDWVARGMLQETQAFSKGSHGKRVKFLRFSAATAKLLRRYCDTERREIDLHHYALDDYLQASRSGKLDLYQAPLFLSYHKTPLAPKTFRDRYWNPACRAAGIEADVHQARHWYVTQIVRGIYEMARSEAELQRRLRELIEYMGWKSGWETLEAYQHYFDPQRHAEIQDQLHQRLDLSLRQSLQDRMLTAPDRSPHQQPCQSIEQVDQPVSGSEVDIDLAYLFALGGRRGNI
jgi:integrase